MSPAYTNTCYVLQTALKYDAGLLWSVQVLSMTAVKPSPTSDLLGRCTKPWWGRACLDNTPLVAGLATFLFVLGIVVTSCAAAAAWKCLSVTRQAGKVCAAAMEAHMMSLHKAGKSAVRLHARLIPVWLPCLDA